MEQSIEPGFDFTNITVETLNTNKTNIPLEFTQAIEKIVNVSKDTPRNYANTVQPLIDAFVLVEPRKSLFDFVINFFPDKELRDAGQEAENEIKKFFIDVMLRRDLYQAFADYQNSTYQQEKSSLSLEQNRFLVHEMRDFRRNGLHLDDEKYNEVKTKLKDLSELCTKYQNNLNEDVTSFEFLKDEIPGMPAHWFCDEKLIKKDENDASSVEKYKLTLKYPDINPVLDYVTNEATRKKMFIAYNSRSAVENTELITKAIQLRYEIAKILGYQYHADYKTELAVIKTGKNAMDFENDMNQKFTPLYEADMKNLLDFAKNESKTPLIKEKFDPWDLRFYIHEITEKECVINMEEVRKYFPLEVVTKGLFEIYQTLLGLVFTEVETKNKWHDEVKLYRVSDKETSEVMGYFYLDLHPRDGKYGHAAAFDFRTGCQISKEERLHHIMAVACNFPKDGCIEFEDVETFFHEFGHVMHQICSKPELTEFAGFGIEWDFIEAPSQLLEYFVYTKEGLALMSKHSETGETVPQELIDKLNKKKNFMGGYFYKRQLLFGIVDLKYHMLTDFSEPVDMQAVWYATEKEVFGVDNETKLFPFASFGHLMGGYDAGYYGYLLAETYAANMFYKMFKFGSVLDQTAGMRYRKKLLEPGSTKEALQLLEDFLGEKPNADFFLKEKGLEKI
jgi:thimet oligopeptidase